MKLPTPIYRFLPSTSSVYPPSEDSFLLLDGLELSLSSLDLDPPCFIVEIGPGSGVISTALSSVFPTSTTISCDLNFQACTETLITSSMNHTLLDVIHDDMLSSMSCRLSNKVDILLFNPPYVPTDYEEVCSAQRVQSISASWAGGSNGVEVLNRFLFNLLPLVLSDSGSCFVVLLEENNPNLISRQLLEISFNSEIVISRKCGIERLSIMRIWRK
ncbi:hypothetical protein RCL1_008752 [Eukaryota sp. TZLM3-RCL]